MKIPSKTAPETSNPKTAAPQGKGAPTARKAVGAGGKDANVSISRTAAESRIRDKDLSESEKLMDLIDAGKLSDGDREIALKRVGEILRKYGSA